MDMMVKRYIDRLLMPVRRRLYSMAGRALITAINEESQRQKFQILIDSDESMDDVEHFQHYGFSSVPPKGSEALVLALNGNNAKRVAINAEKKDLRPKGEASDVFLYHEEGHKIGFLRNGKVHLTAIDVILEASNSISIISPENIIYGPLHVTGGISTDLGIYATGGITSASVISGLDLMAGSISYLGHKHRDAENRLTDIPTAS
ncbi:TPA: phage baseplate assembly protein [Vibrio cholerae]|nr:phage baseplate assembly protein [Vibrio cholerae]